MKSISHNNLALLISKDSEVSEKAVLKVLQSLQNILKTEVLSGNRVKIKDIGSFISIKKEPKTMTGLGKTFRVSAKTKVKFIISKNFAKRNSFSELSKVFKHD